MNARRWLCILALLSLTAPAALLHAADNAAGNWKWSFTTQNGDSFETIMKLKQDGEKLTGAMNNRYGDSAISDGTIKDGKIAFSVKRDINGGEFIIKYAGKLEGDKITGKSEFIRDGQTRERDWEARREPAKAAGVSDAWNSAIILPDGNRLEGTLKLKQEGDKVTGVIVRGENETAIQDAKVTGDEITFKVVRDREGRAVTSKYKGKFSGETVKGKIESDWSGDWQTLDWEGSRAK